MCQPRNTLTDHYWSAPFSHVTMSTSKLLSRIVNADQAGSKSASTFNAGDIQLPGAHKKHAHSTSYGITSDPLTQFSVVFSGTSRSVTQINTARLLACSPAHLPFLFSPVLPALIHGRYFCLASFIVEEIGLFWKIASQTCLYSQLSDVDHPGTFSFSDRNA